MQADDASRQAQAGSQASGLVSEGQVNDRQTSKARGAAIDRYYYNVVYRPAKSLEQPQDAVAALVNQLPRHLASNAGNPPVNASQDGMMKELDQLFDQARNGNTA